MSIITESLPTFLTVHGRACPIRTDFRTWIGVSVCMASNIDNISKISDILKLVYITIPPNLEEALMQIMQFLSHSKQTNERKKENGQRVFDYEYDADIIFSSFMEQYKIDLTNAEMHWWVFKALLEGLNEDTRFAKSVQYRTMDLSKIKDKDQRKFYADMKRIHALPDNRTEQEKEQAFAKSFPSLF